MCVRAELERVINQKHQAVSQVQENEMVVAELEFLEDDAKVFKLIGPILVQQDLVEVKANVGTRIDFIKKDMIRVEKQIKEYERKIDEQRQKVCVGAIILRRFATLHGPASGPAWAERSPSWLTPTPFSQRASQVIKMQQSKAAAQ